MAIPADVVDGELITAETMNAVLAELRAGKEQRGVATVSLVAAAAGTFDLTFPVPFTSAPVISLTVVGTTAFFAHTPTMPTASGMRIGVRHYQGTATTIDVPVHWTARLP